jgi:hypothetical protein
LVLLFLSSEVSRVPIFKTSHILEALMIRGVRATTILFATAKQASGLVLTTGWPWLGSPGKLGSRDVFLTGSRPRRFQVRVFDARTRGKVVSCDVELYDADRGGAVLLKAKLTFAPNGASTSVTLQGSVLPGFAPTSSMQTVLSLRVANEYARALLEQIARDLETWVKAHPAAQAVSLAGKPV